MKLAKMLLSVVALIGFSVPVSAQLNMNKPLENDPAYTIGKLPNGITYYIRHNEEPKDRASFYIMRNAGALLEEDDQNGLAHFLEHMAFNGTKNFPGKGIISTLEKYGVSFGRNINAYTALNETVYNLSDVPTNNKQLIDTCLLILHDWSYYLTLADDEIDNERGVISEEWRSRRNAGARISEQTRPVFFKGSMYAKRDVIGSLDVIQNFPYQLIRDFYHKWYRTDLEAIAVVGDVDVAETEAKIKEIFSSIPAVENPAPRPEYFEVPEHDETYYVLATDPEQTRTNISVNVFFRDTLTKEQKATPAYMREMAKQNFYSAMVSRRISEIMQRPDAPFLAASFGPSGFVPGYTAYSIGTNSRPHAEAQALEAVMTEYERVRRHGFSDEELKPVVTNMLTSLENAYNQRDKTTNEEYIDEIKSNFLHGDVMIPAETYYNMMKEILPTITAAEVSALGQKWDTTRNRILSVSGPSEGEEHLTEARMLEIIDRVRNNPDIAPYAYETVDAALLSTIPTGGKIVKTRELKPFDAVEWTLSNGARVVFRKADYEKDVVSLDGFSWGGTSLYDIDMLPAAGNAASMVGSFGVGDHNPIALRKIMTGNTAQAMAGISTLSESVKASCTPKDVESMMQLVYMKFEQPRYDDELFSTVMERQRISYERSKNMPQKQMQDSLRLIMADYNPRALVMNEAYLDAITMPRLKEVYEDRIKDASDFTFFIVGDIEADSIRPLVEKYIGGISSINRKETWRDNGVRGPKGKVEKVIRLDLPTPKSTVIVSINNTNMKYSLRNDFLNSILKAVLDLRYTENIREKEGGTYGVSVGAGSSNRPYDSYSLTMQFECDPDRAAQLKPLLYTELESIIATPPTQEEFDKVVANMRKEHEQSKPHNSYWMSALKTYYIEGYDATDPKNFDKILDKISPKDVQSFAKQIYNGADIIDITFAPLEKK